jgi:hypothetical protein
MNPILLPLIELTKEAVEAKRKYLVAQTKRVKAHARHIKQSVACEKDLRVSLEPMFRRQIKSIISKLESGGGSKKAISFNTKEATKELVNSVLPILAFRMAEAARAQLNQLGAKKSFNKQTELKTKTTTATDWLEDQDLDELVDGMPSLVSGGLPYRIITELPRPMRERIAKELQQSFSQDYWENIAETTQGDAERVLERGLEEGWSVPRMAQEMRDSLGDDAYAKRRAFNIARTESGNALNSAHKAVIDQVADDLGESLPVRATWLSVLGNTTRDSHAALDGVPANEDGLWDLSGYMIPWPGHFSLPPEERCQCRCSIIAELGLNDEDAGNLIDEYYSRLD